MQPQISRLSKLQRALLTLAFECRGNLDQQTALAVLYGTSYGEENHPHQVSISRAITSLERRGLMRRSVKGMAILTAEGMIFAAELLHNQ